MAFRNPAGDCVVTFSNDAKVPATVAIALGGSNVQIEAPPQSMNSVVFPK